MARAGRIVAATLALMAKTVRPGITTEDLDAEAEEFIRSHDGATPSFKGLYGFPKTLCTSIDDGDRARHSVAKRDADRGQHRERGCGRACSRDCTPTPPRRFPWGHRADAQRLLQVTQESLAAGIAEARVGNHVGDIGHAVQKVAEGAGYGVVRELVGHGIGTRFHEEPQVPNYGKPSPGARGCSKG